MRALCEVRREDPAALATLSLALERELIALGAADRPVAFACIGTDRSTGDALGPLVGQRLLKLGFDPEGVIGTLEEPLHALNLEERVQPLRAHPSRPLVVAVDAALGSTAGVGSVNLRRGGLLPGQGVGKALPAVGELSVTATVNVQAGALDVQILQSTRLYLVQELAELIGVACWWAHRNVRRAAVAPAQALAV
ncbi:spore protease YyaC [Miltoncostaea oceani]|uniref:spore protease YyaC n=1 Tax=Miltoncostaea oceani TaxID=2843216 RepID=UPI001C3E04CC|nr:spore protease YyaC [Miltoncostaea oceani]